MQEKSYDVCMDVKTQAFGHFLISEGNIGKYSKQTCRPPISEQMNLNMI